jgi:O-antigen/teichoic acid export membrane protein
MRYNPPGSFERNRRLSQAALTSLSSRLVSMCAQVLAFPVAYRALGQDSFACFAVLNASIGWINILTGGISPGVARSVGVQLAHGNIRDLQTLFTTSFFTIRTIAIAAFIIVFALATMCDPVALYGSSFQVFRSQITFSLVSFSVLGSIGLMCGLIEAFQAGFQDQRKLGLANTLGNILTICGYLIVSRFPSVLMMVLATHLGMIIGRVANSVLFLYSHKEILLIKKRPIYKDFIGLVKTSIPFLGAQITNVIAIDLTILKLGMEAGKFEVSSFSLCMQLVTIIMSVPALFIIPVTPAVVSAVALGDLEWVKRKLKSISVISIIFSTVSALILTMQGDVIFQFWVGSNFVPSQQLRLILSCYLIVLTVEQIGYAFLIGFGKIWAASLTIFMRGILCMLMVNGLPVKNSSTNSFLILVTSCVVTSLWYFPLLIIKRFRETVI